MPSHSSANRMVWQYFEALRRAVSRSHAAEESEQQKQEVAVAIFLAVTTVEVFLNLFFRVIVEEDGFQRHKKRLIKDLSPPFLSLDQKWKLWPQSILGQAIDLNDGPGKEFVELKDIRNRLMHFTSTHETLRVSESIRIEGLPNVSVLDDLDAAYADRALRIAVGAISAVLVARGVPCAAIPRNVQHWTGRMSA